MRVGSLFSGAGMFDLAFRNAGFEIAWQVEIDATARDVLARHFPDVPRHEDVRGVGAHNLAPVDVIVGGSPCQDFSVAGKRAGVWGERSGLFEEMARIVGELRPAFVLWENVPGILSGYTDLEGEPDDEATDDRAERGTDGVGAGDAVRACWMGAVLRAFSALGYGGAYRVLDARHFGVPQSRKRVFGVFARDTGDGASVECCSEILALSEGVRGDSQAGEEAGARPAAATEGGAGGDGEVVGSLLAPREGSGHRVGADEAAAGHLVFSERGEGHATYQEADTAGAQRAGGGGAVTANLAVFGGGASGERGVAAALSAKAGTRQDFDTENLVAFQCHGSNIGPAGTQRSGGGVGSGVPFVFNWQSGGDVRLGVSETHVTALQCEQTPAVFEPVVPCLSGDGDPKGRDDGLAFTLKARANRGHGDGKAVAVRTANTGANGLGVQEGASFTLDSNPQSQAVCVTVPVTHTLTGEGHDASEDGTGRGTPIVFRAIEGEGASAEAAPTLRAESGDPHMTGRMAVAFAQNQRGELRVSDAAPAGNCGGGKPGQGYPAAMVAGTVRRLTPVECERLMGLPDDWTRYRANGSEISDGPRYRMCGNGVVVTVAQWIAERIRRVR